METFIDNNAELNLSQYSYLRPSENLLSVYANHSKEYAKFIDEKQYHVRTLFSNVEYDNLEETNVQSFKFFIEDKHLILPKHFDDSYILRFLYCCNFNYENTLMKITDHIQACAEHFDQNVAKLNYIKEGAFYLYGRDKALRPIVYIIFSKLLLKIKDKNFKEMEIVEDFVFLLECIKRNMLVPGKVEKWIIFFDVKGLALNMPIKVIQKIVGVMENLYPLFLEKIYILNPSQAFQILYKWAEKSFLKKSHTDKIFVLRDINLKEIYEYIPLHQLPVSYGGELPQLEQYWPPVNTLDKFTEEKKENFVKEEHIVKEENISEEILDFKEALKLATQMKKEKNHQRNRMCEGFNCFRSSQKTQNEEEKTEKNNESCMLI